MTLEQRITAAKTIAERMRKYADDLVLASQNDKKAIGRVDYHIQQGTWGLTFSPITIRSIIDNQD
jgi:hypothetical protein